MDNSTVGGVRKKFSHPGLQVFDNNSAGNGPRRSVDIYSKGWCSTMYPVNQLLD